MQENNGMQPPNPSQYPGQEPQPQPMPQFDPQAQAQPQPQYQPQPQPQAIPEQPGVPSLQQPSNPFEMQLASPAQAPVQPTGVPQQPVMGANIGSTPVVGASKSKKPLIIVAAIVAALLLLGGAAWAIMSMNSSSSGGDSSGPESSAVVGSTTPSDQKESVVVENKYNLDVVCEGKKASNAGAYQAPYTVDSFMLLDGEWSYSIDVSTEEGGSSGIDASGTNVVMCLTRDDSSAGEAQACPAGRDREVSLKPVDFNYVFYAAQTGDLISEGSLRADECPPEWMFSLGDGSGYMTWSSDAMGKLRANPSNA